MLRVINNQQPQEVKTMNEHLEEVYELDGKYVFLDKTPLTQLELENCFVHKGSCWTLRGRTKQQKNKVSAADLAAVAVMLPLNILTAPISFILSGDPTGLF